MDSLTITSRYSSGQRVMLAFRPDRTGTIETSMLHRLDTEVYAVEYKVRWDDVPDDLSSLYHADVLPMEEPAVAA